MSEPERTDGQGKLHNRAARASKKKMPKMPPKMKAASIVVSANPRAAAVQTSHFVCRVAR